jgi:hypothetical protein
MNPHAPPGFDVQFYEVALEIALMNSCKQYSFPIKATSPP